MTDPGNTESPPLPLSLTDRAAGALLRLISKRKTVRPDDYEEAYFRNGASEAHTFLRRFAVPVDFRGKRVLDHGCGYGALSFHLAQDEGAAEVIGIDIDRARIDFARRKLSDEYAGLAGTVEFKSPEEVGEDRFDIVVSKDSFQHYNDPAAELAAMKQRLAPGGLIAIGFGPLWKSPYGGAINFMTRLPWAHLLFSERVLMRARMRYRPDEKARTYEETRGGFNKMTLRRFREVVADSGLNVLSFRTNASAGAIGKASRLLARIPGCREYFALNVYTTLTAERPAGGPPPGG